MITSPSAFVTMAVALVTKKLASYSKVEPRH